MLIIFIQSTKMKSEPHIIKILTIGDGAVGKNCILSVIADNQFPTQYGPVLVKQYIKQIKAGDKQLILQLNTVSGQEQLRKLQDLAISMNQVFLVVFSVVEPDSFANAIKKWLPQLQQKSPRSLKIIVGNKTDLRKQYTERAKNLKQLPVTDQYVRDIIRDKFNNRYQYFECSSLNREGLDNIINYIIGEFFNKKQNSKTNPDCQLF